MASFRGISSQRWWGKRKSTQKKLEWRTCPGSPCFCWRLKSNRRKLTHPEKSIKLTGSMESWKQFLFLACRWNFGVWRNCTTGTISPYICQMKRYWLSTCEDLNALVSSDAFDSSVATSSPCEFLQVTRKRSQPALHGLIGFSVLSLWWGIPNFLLHTKFMFLFVFLDI